MPSHNLNLILNSHMWFSQDSRHYTSPMRKGYLIDVVSETEILVLRTDSAAQPNRREPVQGSIATAEPRTEKGTVIRKFKSEYALGSWLRSIL